MQRAELQPESVQLNNVLDIENPPPQQQQQQAEPRRSRRLSRRRRQQQQQALLFRELLEDIPEEKANRIRITANKVLLAVEAHTDAIIRGGKFCNVPGELFNQIMTSQKQLMSSFDCYSTSAMATLKDAPDSGSSNRNDYHGNSNKRKRRNVLVLRDDDINTNGEDEPYDNEFFKIDEDDYLVMCDVLNDFWPAFASYSSAKYVTILQAMRDFVEVDKLDGLFRITKLEIPFWVDSIILPKSIRGLECLEVFQARISGNTFPLWIFELKNLTELVLTGPNNPLSKVLLSPRIIPFELGNLKSLKNLKLAGFHDILGLPESIGKCLPILSFFLKEVNVQDKRHNRILTLLLMMHFPSFSKSGNLKKLELLMVRNASKMHYFGELGGLTSLKYLCINDTAISTLPLSIKYLKKLKVLDLSSNKKLRHIPDYIQYLSGLELIRLSRTKIVSLPGTIGKLANLSYIDLDYTERLKRLPDEFNSLTNLKVISLEHSGISSLPNIEGLQSLEKLDINGSTKLETLPDGIFAGLNIRTIDLSSCSISSLPKSIGSLRNLEELNISFINLETTDISRDIDRILLGCSSLKFLIVQSNNIVKINPNDAAYRNLEVFDLYGNPILSDGNKSGNEMLLNLIQNCPYLGCIGDLTDDNVEVKPEFAQHVYLLTKNRIRKRLSSLGSEHGALWPYILSRNVDGYGCGKAALLPSHHCCGGGCDYGADCCATASLSHADCIFRLLVDHSGHNIISQHS
jgi:leucine-rich repeat protein SHOC2